MGEGPEQSQQKALVQESEVEITRPELVGRAREDEIQVDSAQELRRNQRIQEKSRWAQELGNLKEAGVMGSSGQNGGTVIRVSLGLSQ